MPQLIRAIQPLNSIRKTAMHIKGITHPICNAPVYDPADVAPPGVSTKDQRAMLRRAKFHLLAARFRQAQAVRIVSFLEPNGESMVACVDAQDVLSVNAAATGELFAKSRPGQHLEPCISGQHRWSRREPPGAPQSQVSTTP